MKIDKEFRDLIPQLTEDEYKGLEDSVIKEGCRDAICVWDGKDIIVDGHNRYNICTKNDIKYKAKALKFEDRNEVKKWIIGNQFNRRNLNAYQRSELALELENIVAEQAKERQREGGKVKDICPQPPIQTRDILGKKAGVSGKTIDRVKVETNEERKMPEKAKKIREPKVYEHRTVRRKCSKCGKLRPCRANSTAKNGTQKMCYKCLSKANKEWYEKNRKRKLEYQRKYRLLGKTKDNESN